MRKIPLTTYLEPTDIEKLEKMSRLTGKSLSMLLREAVRDFLIFEKEETEA